jgi:hypothetical protein
MRTIQPQSSLVTGDKFEHEGPGVDVERESCDSFCCSCEAYAHPSCNRVLPRWRGERNLREHGSHGFTTLEGLKYSKETPALIKAWSRLV